MSLNKVQLIGNVGKDPDVRYLDSGVAVATFPLATTDRGYTLANGTQVPERTEWKRHRIVALLCQKFLCRCSRFLHRLF